MDKLDIVAKYLLEHETMDGNTFESVFENPEQFLESADNTEKPKDEQDFTSEADEEKE